MAPSATADHQETAQVVTEGTCPLVKGFYVPTVAFFNDNEDVDVDTTFRHASYLASTGVAGIVTHGSNGEAVHLDHEDRKIITQTTRQALDQSGNSNKPVIVGCGAPSTREVIKLCKDAAASGGNYALVLPPSYYGPLLTSKLMLDHFRNVADASPIPVLIYNFPGASSGLDLSSDQILEMAQHPNIVGVSFPH